MRRESFVSPVAAVVAVTVFVCLAMLAGCSCGRVNTDDVKKPVVARRVENAETEDYRLDEVTEEDLQAAEKKGYADGIRDGGEWLQSNPDHGLIVSVEYPEDHCGYRQYQKIIAYNEG